VRILRAYHARLPETSDPEMPLLAISDYLNISHRCRGGHPVRIDQHAGQRRLQRRQIRDRFLPDGWLARRMFEDHPLIRTRWPGATLQGR